MLQMDLRARIHRMIDEVHGNADNLEQLHANVDAIPEDDLPDALTRLRAVRSLLNLKRDATEPTSEAPAEDSPEDRA
jgi:hypothetical protein